MNGRYLKKELQKTLPDAKIIRVKKGKTCWQFQTLASTVWDQKAVDAAIDAAQKKWNEERASCRSEERLIKQIEEERREKVLRETGRDTQGIPGFQGFRMPDKKEEV